MSIDLHCHSTASDGLLSPAEVVERAAAQGVRALALTDHDTTAGLAAAAEAAAMHDLTLIPGVEMSALWEGRTLHVLGLRIDPDAPTMATALAEQARLRQERGAEMAHRFAKAGLDDVAERAWQLAGDGSVGRMHFARALVALGHVRNEEAAFRRWLKAGRPAHVRGGWLSLAEAVRAIRESGGTPVIAHPLRYDLSHTKLLGLVKDFLEAGGEALELGPARLSSQEIDTILGLCGRHGLAFSVGSDFHTPGPMAELGQVVRIPPRLPSVWERWGWDRESARAD
jgi:3',5'-nucleoside bisphosphate phosphatase